MPKYKKQFTNVEVNEIVNLYKTSNVSLQSLAKQYKCGVTTIKEVLVSNNIKIIPKGNWIPVKDVKKAKELYDSGISLSKIAKLIGHNKDSISRRLKALGVTIVNRQNLSRIDEHVFDIIDTEEKAYWLGFMFADGYIGSPLAKGKNCGKNVYAISISIQLKDYNHLLKFNTFMKHNKINIHIDTSDITRPYCTWNIRNKHLWETLNSYGCVPRKSLILKFPNIKIFKYKHLIKDFIRGFFDGDGCLSYSSGWSSKIYPKCGFTGTVDMLDNIDKHLGKTSKRYKCTGFDYQWNGCTWCSWYSSKNTVDIINNLYKDATIYLDRKYNLYKFFKNGSRSLKEFNELLSSKIGETWNGNPEVISEITKGSETP